MQLKRHPQQMHVDQVNQSKICYCCPGSELYTFFDRKASTLYFMPRDIVCLIPFCKNVLFNAIF